jgi:hypothetical protein
MKKLIVLKKGAYVGGYKSNGEHYVLLYDDKWELCTGYDKLLIKGKISTQNDADYILSLAKN